MSLNTHETDNNQNFISRKVFCNVELNGEAMEAVGFDMDFTLAQVYNYNNHKFLLNERVVQLSNNRISFNLNFMIIIKCCSILPNLIC